MDRSYNKGLNHNRKSNTTDPATPSNDSGPQSCTTSPGEISPRATPPYSAEDCLDRFERRLSMSLEEIRHHEEEQQQQHETAHDPKNSASETATPPRKTTVPQHTSLTGIKVGANFGDSHLPEPEATMAQKPDRTAMPSPETKELQKASFTDKDTGTNIGDAQHQETAHEEAENRAHSNTKGPAGRNALQGIRAPSLETKCLQKTSLTGNNIGTNIGDTCHQDLAHKGAEHKPHLSARESAAGNTPNQGAFSPETEELKQASITSGDYRTNIGDSVPHEMAHKEAARHDPQHISTNRVSGKIQQKPATTSNPHQKETVHNEHHSGRTLDMGFTTSPAEFTSDPATPTAKEKIATAGVSRFPGADRVKGHESKATRRSIEDHAGHSASPASPPLLRTEFLELQEGRDSAIADLKRSVGRLSARMDRLENLGSAAAREESFTTVKVMDDKVKGDVDGLVTWCWRAGVLMGVAVVGGWMGAQMERGALGGGMAEWIWRQAVRGVNNG